MCARLGEAGDRAEIAEEPPLTDFTKGEILAVKRRLIAVVTKLDPLIASVFRLRLAGGRSRISPWAKSMSGIPFSRDLGYSLLNRSSDFFPQARSRRCGATARSHAVHR